MPDYTIVLPSKPKIISEEEFKGVYEIDGLYPGYGHTLGNSLRRIILSSLPGAAITSVKIAGVSHEFSVLDGVKEDMITLLLNLKRVRIKMLTDEPQTLRFNVKGVKEVTAGDIEKMGQVEILNPELSIANLTSANAVLDVEMTVERGLGFISKETLQKGKVDIGTIALDAIFTPIRRVNYEVENMRVGDRTDFNRLRIFVETDGTISPKDALERSIEIMINQLKAIVGFKEEDLEELKAEKEVETEEKKKAKDVDPEVLKTRIETLALSARTMNALLNGNVRTVGGLVRKKEDDVLNIEGIGAKGIEEIKEALTALNLSLKD
ncbi:MAG: DNA-directed RNA polymerase subunit alpha [Patescibacteria group bacterium]|nr:DNA-directed RNA polymerase subunit alpha [bacterium]MDZ4240556.1 DNA-directed RNA polymerase subunit alpha [Patescibacteria group bacterium]